MHRKKVLFLTSWYPNQHSIFQGNFVQRTAKTLAQAHDIWVVSAQQVDGLKENFVLEHHQPAKNLNEIIIYFRNSNWSVITHVRRFIAFMKGIEMVGDYDFVHGNVMNEIAPTLLFLRKFKNKKYILTEHWSGLNHINAKYLSKNHLRLYAMVTQNAEKILPVSQYLAKCMQQIGLKGDYSTIPNVVNEVLFVPTSMELKKSYAKFLHISNFVQTKNIEGILRACQILVEDKIDFTLTLAGDGELADMQRTQKLIAEMNLGKHVVLHGAMNLEEVAKMMQNHDIFILFSNFENQPCVLNEAMSCGMPVIATDVGGIREYVKANNGVLVQPNDYKDLANQMRWMMENANKFNPLQIREFAVEHFSQKAHLAMYNQIYQQL